MSLKQGSYIDQVNIKIQSEIKKINPFLEGKLLAFLWSIMIRQQTNKVTNSRIDHERITSFILSKNNNNYQARNFKQLDAQRMRRWGDFSEKQ